MCLWGNLMEVEIFVKTIKDSEDASSSKIDIDIPPYYLIQKNSDDFRTCGREAVKDSLHEEDQLAISRLTLALEIVESDNFQIVIKDSRNAYNLCELWLKYHTIRTPLIVIGNQIFNENHSIVKLVQAILTPSFEWHTSGLDYENEEDLVYSVSVHQADKA